MSLMTDLEDALAEHGPCSVEDLMPHLEMTPTQARKAAANLATEGRIRLVFRGDRRSNLANRKPSIYEYIERQPIRGGEFWQRQVPSVFHLGGMV